MSIANSIANGRRAWVEERAGDPVARPAPLYERSWVER